jgi:hypothetical protein
MDNYLEQTFNFNSIKIGTMTNAGVLKIGSAGMVKRTSPSIYGQFGTLSGINSALLSPAVPLEAPVRNKSMVLP